MSSRNCDAHVSAVIECCRGPGEQTNPLIAQQNGHGDRDKRVTDSAIAFAQTCNGELSLLFWEIESRRNYKRNGGFGGFLSGGEEFETELKQFAIVPRLNFPL